MHYAAGAQLTSVAICDLDGDSDADLALAVFHTDSVSVFLNEGPEPCPWDHNLDNMVNPADIQMIIAHFGPACTHDGAAWNNPVCAELDHNGDLLINPADIQSVIANFGPCPQWN